MAFCKNKSAFWSDKSPFYFVKTAIYFAKNIDFFRAFSSEKIAFVTVWFSNRSFLHKKIAVFFQKIFVFFEKIGVFLVRKRRFFSSVSKSGFFECKNQQKNKGKNSEKIRRKIGRFCPFFDQTDNMQSPNQNSRHQNVMLRLVFPNYSVSKNKSALSIVRDR